ncbi:MAG: hypothetical protein ACI9L9_000257, partial [Marivirga sp.]
GKYPWVPFLFSIACNKVVLNRITLNKYDRFRSKD